MATFRFQSRVPQAEAKVNAATQQALKLAVEYLLTEANKTVPHDEGTLERSGSTDTDGMVGAVSYDTPYAVRQHESLNYRHSGKGRAKWLERTFSEKGKTVARIMAEAIKRQVD